MNQKTSIYANEGNTMKMILPVSYSHIIVTQQRLRNSFLRTLINTDYKGFKNHVLLLHNCAKEKINDAYQEVLTNFYNNVLHYYSMEEKDVFMIENILQILF
jgi:hypothetical protein